MSRVQSPPSASQWPCSSTDRALVYGTRGWRCKSSQGHQAPIGKPAHPLVSATRTPGANPGGSISGRCGGASRRAGLRARKLGVQVPPAASGVRHDDVPHSAASHPRLADASRLPVRSYKPWPSGSTPERPICPAREISTPAQLKPGNSRCKSEAGHHEHKVP